MYSTRPIYNAFFSLSVSDSLVSYPSNVAVGCSVFFEVLLYFPNVESIPGKPEEYISFCLGERYCDLVKSNINYIKSILHFPEYMLLMTSTTAFVSSLVSRVLSLSRTSSRRFLQIFLA